MSTKIFIISETVNGLPECPQVFPAEPQAQAAFVRIVKDNFGKDYLAHCELGGVDPDAFESALSYTEESNTFGSIDLRLFESEMAMPEEPCH